MRLPCKRLSVFLKIQFFALSLNPKFYIINYSLLKLTFMKSKHFSFCKKAFTALFTLFIMACSNDLQTGIKSLEISEILFEEADLNGNAFAKFAELTDNTIVSPAEAIDIAEKFFNTQTTRKLNTKNVSVESFGEDNHPLMYIVNFEEGGFIIVCATKNYYPILAFSEKNSFAFEEDMGGVVVWLKETEEAIKYSCYFDDKRKSSINTMWKYFDTSEDDISNEIHIRRYDPGSEMASRINYLKSQYGGQGWNTFVPLSNAQSYFGVYPALWSGLCSVANAYGSPTNYTIVGLKYDMMGVQTGPLLSTLWGQGYPFNYLNNGGSLGCTVVAMAQLMRFHQWPTNFNWIGMPDNDSNPIDVINSDLPALMQNIRNSMGMTPGQTNATITQVKNAFQNTYGYIVTQASHNFYDVMNEILNNNRPIYMRGSEINSGVGHAWVCDGVQTTYVHIYYFVEYMVNYKYGDYTYSIPGGLPTPANPGLAQNASDPNEYTYFHMNWGWKGSKNDWFFNNDIYIPSQGNYSVDRQNLYVRR